MKTKTTWSDRIVDESGLVSIHQAVLKTEAKTSAEIVPMIVRSSTLTGHVPWVVYLFFLVIGVTSTPFLSNVSSDVPGWLLDTFVLVIPAVLAFVFSRSDFVKRICTPKMDRLLGVQHRALLEFYISRINTTENHTGVLIFVSLLERRAVILADEKISSKFPEKTWHEVIQKLLEQTGRGEFAKGMCAAIESLGHILEGEFPLRNSRAHHELVDRLVVKD